MDLMHKQAQFEFNARPNRQPVVGQTLE